MLYLVRHGLTRHNENSILLGSTEVGLSPIGLRQIGWLKNELQRLECRPTRLISSSSLRCRQTVEKLKVLGFKESEILILDRLRERDFGKLEGFSRELLLRYRHEMGIAKVEDPTQDWPSGMGVETDEEMWERIRPVVEPPAIERIYEKEDVLIVAHAGTIRVILKYMCSSDAGGRSRVYVGPAGIVRLWQNSLSGRMTIDQVRNL